MSSHWFSGSWAPNFPLCLWKSPWKCTRRYLIMLSCRREHSALCFKKGFLKTKKDSTCKFCVHLLFQMHMFVARYCDLLNVDISCDGCDEIAPWHRYRCLQCNDMDLCKTCFLGKDLVRKYFWSQNSVFPDNILESFLWNEWGKDFSFGNFPRS